MGAVDFADFQEAIIYVAGPSLAWLLSFAEAGAILMAVVAVAAGIVRRVRNWT